MAYRKTKKKEKRGKNKPISKEKELSFDKCCKRFDDDDDGSIKFKMF